MNFQQAEEKFKQLKAQFVAEGLTEDEFKSQLKDLMVQDDHGNWWMIGYETEQWYRHNGTDWVQTGREVMRKASNHETYQRSTQKKTTSFGARWWRVIGFLIVIVISFLLSTLNPCYYGPLLGMVAIGILGVEHLSKKRFPQAILYLCSAILLPFSECGLVYLRDFTFFVNVLLWITVPLIVIWEFRMAKRGRRG